MFTDELCTPKGCHVSSIADTYGGGFCCGYGAGSYHFFVDGVSVIGNVGELGSSAFTLFENCQNIGTSAASGDKRKDKPRKE
jgi:hypothetical protein